MKRPCDPWTAANPTSLMRRVRTTQPLFLIDAMIDGNGSESKHCHRRCSLAKALFRRAKLRCASNEQRLSRADYIGFRFRNFYAALPSDDDFHLAENRSRLGDTGENYSPFAWRYDYLIEK